MNVIVFITELVSFRCLNAIRQRFGVTEYVVKLSATWT